tara:strand:- start:4567 stop:5208 length:642 start_codon:yes stop_codon:yes gene_type:complete
MKKSLIAITVLSAMASGYRRAGFALDKGENELEATEEQIQLLSADENVKVVAELENQAEIEPHLKSERILQTNVEQLRNENAVLKDENETLTNLCTELQENINLLEIEIANPPKYIQEDTREGLSDDSIEINGLNVSSAPEELHHFIALLDDLNQEAPLTKKPNCDHLKMTVNGGDVTPTAEQRDAAWAWYKDNVKVHEADDANSNSTTEAEA